MDAQKMKWTVLKHDLVDRFCTNRKQFKFSIVAGLVCSACTFLGSSLNKQETLPVFTASPLLFLMITYYLFLAVIYSSIIYCALSFIESKNVFNVKTVAPKDLRRFFVRREIVLLVLWLPFLLVSLPGSVHGDYIVQLRQFLGAAALTNHHPIITTFLYGMLYNAGCAIFHNPNGGILFTVLCQAVLLSFSMSFSTTVFYRYGANKAICNCVIAFYALVPIFPLFAFDCIKDTPACAFILFFYTQICARYCATRQGRSIPIWLSFPAIIVSAILCSLLRNNFFYCILPAVFFAFLNVRNLRTALICSVCIAMCIFAWNNVVLATLGVEKGNMREALSVPMQQIVYTMSKHPRDLRRSELKTIEQLTVVDSESLVNRYTYKISDPVKSVFDLHDAKDLADFLKVWASIGLRHPKSYLTAFLLGNHGYWYPFLKLEDIKWANPLSISPDDYIASLQSDLQFKFEGESAQLLKIAPHNRNVRDAARDFINSIGSIPILSLLFNPAFFIWLSLIFSGWLLYKHKISAPFVLCLMLFLTCCASPDFSNVRYALPFFAFAPAILLFLACIQQSLLTNDTSGNDFDPL